MNNKKLIIFIDSGDTIIDEGTEIRDDEDVVLKADPIPGMVEVVKSLYEQGYTLALVADGLAQSFKNIFKQNDIYDYFTTMIYSETIKQKKPHPSMFKAAIGALNLSEADIGRIIMVGNNLKRDIKGANQMGIISVFYDWSPRYPRIPEDEDQKPDFIIRRPEELLTLVEELESRL